MTTRPPVSIVRDERSAIDVLRTTGTVIVPISQAEKVLEEARFKSLIPVSLHEIDCDGIGMVRQQLLLHFDVNDFSDLAHDQVKSFAFNFFIRELKEHLMINSNEFYAEIFCIDESEL